MELMSAWPPLPGRGGAGRSSDNAERNAEPLRYEGNAPAFAREPTAA